MSTQKWLPPEDVPVDFQKHVHAVLNKELMGNECEERIWGKTPLGQYFVLIVTKVILKIIYVY